MRELATVRERSGASGRPGLGRRAVGGSHDRPDRLGGRDRAGSVRSLGIERAVPGGARQIPLRDYPRATHRPTGLTGLNAVDSVCEPGARSPRYACSCRLRPSREGAVLPKRPHPRWRMALMISLLAIGSLNLMYGTVRWGTSWRRGMERCDRWLRSDRARSVDESET